MQRSTWVPYVLILGFSALLLSAERALAEAESLSGQPRTGRYRGDLTDPGTGDVIMKVAMQAPDKLPAQKHLGLLLLFHGFKGHENNYIGLTVDARSAFSSSISTWSSAANRKGRLDDGGRTPVLRLIRWAGNLSHRSAAHFYLWQLERCCLRRTVRFNTPRAFRGRRRLLRQLSLWSRSEGTTQRESNRMVLRARRQGQSAELAPCLCSAQAVGLSLCVSANGRLRPYRHLGWPQTSRPFRSGCRSRRLAVVDARLASQGTRAERAEQQALAGCGKSSRPHNPMNSIDCLRVARIGGGRGRRPHQALASPNPALEPRRRTTEQTLYNQAVIASLIALLHDQTQDVRAAAIRGLAGAANWRDMEAQKALCRLARTADTASADRLLAVDALHRATRLALLGNFEDALPVWTLVALLDDENLQIRQAAFAVLGKNVPDTFAYRPDLPQPDRKTAVKKWQAWCLETCGPEPK